ncbi:hypothetical protein Tco_0568346 [Tanacetum coccineum]
MHPCCVLVKPHAPFSMGRSEEEVEVRQSGRYGDGCDVVGGEVRRLVVGRNNGAALETLVMEEKSSKEKGDPENINTDPPSPPDPSTLFITKKVCKLNSFLESLNLVSESSDMKFGCTKENDGDVMFIEIVKKHDDPYEEEFGEDNGAATRELEVEYFDKFLTRSKLTYHKYLMCGPISSLFLRDPIIVGGCPLNLKIPCNIGHVHVENAYIDLNSPLNVMTRMQYNWIIKKQLEPKEDHEGIKGVCNFTGRIKGMHIIIVNFSYVSDFMIVEDISSIIDPRLSQVVLGRPFVEVSNMTHDLSLGIVKFTDGTNKVSYMMPHKIEQYNLLSDL